MLISDRYHFIFIHIYKNAGTSISKALRPFARNKLELIINHLCKKIGLSVFEPSPYEGHITAAELVDKIGHERFKSYFSFAIVRNPWDWQVSLYNFALKNPKHFEHELTKSFGSFENYLAWRCDGNLALQRDFVFSRDGEQLVDYIGRFETLEEDFQAICDRIGVKATLPRRNVYRSDDYRSYYNDKTIELVRQYFAEDIATFGYDFE